MSRPRDLLKGTKEDLKQVLEEYIDGMVESHIEAWKDRYYFKSKECIKEDLYINHDPSLEIDNVEDWVGRSLTDEEKDLVVEFFNQSVLAEFEE